MSASFTVVNRDNSLPPLLLPNLNSNPNLNPVNYHDKGYDYSLMGVGNVKGHLAPFFTHKAVTAAEPVSNSSSAVSLSPSPSVSPLMSASFLKLDELAMVATKRPKLNAKLAAKPRKTQARSSNNSNSGGNSNNKRQRVGPSCDKCRAKKIKCDAQSDIVVQDPEIVALFSESLHYEFTSEEVLSGDSEISRFLSAKNLQKNKYLVGLRDSLAKSRNVTNRSLVKHIDKIIVFQPCSSCQKKKNNLLLTANSTPIEIRQNPKFQKTHELLISHCDCTFSKGFTRNDISIYTKINYHQKKGKSIGNMLEEEESTIYKMTTTDYFAASL